MPPQQQDDISATSNDEEGGGSSSAPNAPARSSSLFPTSQRMDPDAPPPSARRSSFIVEFAKTKGPPQITIVMMLVAIGLGSTIAVVPAVMSDRYARLNHGYGGVMACAEIPVEARPEACSLGSADAQNVAAEASLAMNGLTFLTSSLIGSLSDEHGRKPILMIGLFISMLSPLALYVTQLAPSVSPWWYYGANVANGFVNWVAIGLSSLNDVLPQELRAPGLGLFLAGSMLGISLSPVFAIFLSHTNLALLSFAMSFGGFLCTVFVLPETLPPAVAAEARRRRSELYRRDEAPSPTTPSSDDDDAATAAGVRGSSVRLRGGLLWWLIVRPIREMSILNRNAFFRLISLLAFFSGMVSSGDQLLLVYYLEEHLGFTDGDVSVVFLIYGVTGTLAQAFLLKPLNESLGEKMVVALCFSVGAAVNTMYGTATNKATIYAAVVIAAFNGMAFPTISAIKSNNVDASEQGRIQGALYSLQALASGVGPVTLRYVGSVADGGPLGAGSMFVFAGCLYLCAVATACALPVELANSSSSSHHPRGGDVDGGDDASVPLLDGAIAGSVEGGGDGDRNEEEDDVLRTPAGSYGSA